MTTKDYRFNNGIKTNFAKKNCEGFAHGHYVDGKEFIEGYKPTLEEAMIAANMVLPAAPNNRPAYLR